MTHSPTSNPTASPTTNPTQVLSAVPTESCDGIPKSGWRSIDGSDRVDGLGEAETPLLRIALDLSYPDSAGEELAAGPNARDISNAVAVQQSLNGNLDGLSDLFWQFGQFLDHDLDLTAEGIEFGDASIPVLDPSDPFAASNCSAIKFHRSEHDDSVPRRQINEITHFLDASNVYGSDEGTAASLRTMVDGLMKTSQGGLMLPKTGDNYQGKKRVGSLFGFPCCIPFPVLTVEVLPGLQLETAEPTSRLV